MTMALHRKWQFHVPRYAIRRAPPPGFVAPLQTSKIAERYSEGLSSPVLLRILESNTHCEAMTILGVGRPMRYPYKTFPKHRCFSIQCESYAEEIPSSMVAVECEGGCGVIFCSTDCMKAHIDYGHRLACEHIRKS